jgi:hypothetical protein
MAFQVSCPMCDSRMRLKDQLYEERVRGTVYFEASANKFEPAKMTAP